MDKKGSVGEKEKKSFEINLPFLKKKDTIKEAKRLSNQLVAIDVGGASIKVVEGRVKDNRLDIKAVGSYDLPEGSVNRGNIVRANEVEGSIYNALAASDIRLKDAVVTIESTEIIQRDITLPALGEGEIENMLQYEMVQHLPIDTSSYAIQHRIMEKTAGMEGNNQIKMNVVAMPKKLANDYMEIFKNIKLVPKAMDTQSNSMRKLMEMEAEHNPIVSSRNIALVDMGHSLFNIQFYARGKYLLSRLSEVGGREINDSMRRILSESDDEIEKLKTHNFSRISALDLYKEYSLSTRGGSDNADEMVFRESLNVFENWVRVIDTVIKFYNTQPAGRINPVDEIYLYGGSSRIKDIDKLFENRLNIPVSVMNKLQCIDYPGAMDISNIPRYLNAFGALIRMN